MAKKVVLSPTAKLKLEGLLVYLKQEWSEKVRQELIEKLDIKINQISRYPKSCPESKVFMLLKKSNEETTSVNLTPTEKAAVDKGLTSIKEGRFKSHEEVTEATRKKHNHLFK